MFNRLYIHVPFCKNKCHYCAFVSTTPDNNELMEYPGLLGRELQLRTGKAEPLESIYFGGGTPSLLKPEQVAGLLGEIAAQIPIRKEAEITLEANPGTVDLLSLMAFHNAGINRISLGVQSFDDRFLSCLGRIHSAEQSRQAFQAARQAGFTNISIDLIHSLPGQSLDQWRFELQQAVNLGPEHISIYGLTVEADTPFSRQYPANSPDLADEDLSADMFEYTDEFLSGSGFDHYEIANYARPGYRSQHNSGYWQRDGYLGLGVAAHSFLRDGYGVRFSNPDTLEEYRQGILSGQLKRVDEQRLTEDDAMAEYMFLGLRLADGICQCAFEREFGQSFAEVYGSVTVNLVRLGLLSQNGEILALTQRGMLLSNQVFVHFIQSPIYS
ncbi:MAG TPA: radical SAM family heme chaperone HemW [Desulfuromonadales bacterium]|nr:radical SAM family heme chaperone HemW [Desulfuromonadales bacterium]